MYSNQTKKEWRTIARSLISEHASDISLRHVQKVIDSEEYKAAKIVALYFSVSTEPSTKEIISNAFAEHKRVAVPIYNPITRLYEWGEYLPDAKLFESRFGIVEPEQAPRINPLEISVCYLPGLLFDKTGVRLGHGGGFYDRLLVQLSPTTPIIGLSFPWQIVDSLPHEGHDIICSRVIY